MSLDFLKDLMNKLFFSCLQFCLVYMDDLLCFSDSPEQHLTHLRTIFTKFRTAKLKVKLSKSDYFKQELEFLGHKLGPHGISPANDKKSAIDRIKPPTNVQEVRSVIGLLGYLNFYIPAYSELIQHMTRLTRKNVPFHWDDKCCRVLELAKLHLQQSPLMIYPNKSKVFHLFTDSSNYTWSSSLMQVIDEGNPVPPPEKREEKVLSSSLPTKKQPPPTFFSTVNHYTPLCFIVAPLQDLLSTGVHLRNRQLRFLKQYYECRFI